MSAESVVGGRCGRDGMAGRRQYLRKSNFRSPLALRAILHFCVHGRLTESKVLTASTACECLPKRVDGNTGIRKLQKLRIGEIVGAITTGDAVSNDRLSTAALML